MVFTALLAIFMGFTKYSCQSRDFLEKNSGNRSKERSWNVETRGQFLLTARKLMFGAKKTSALPIIRSIFGQPKYQKQKLSILLGILNLLIFAFGYFLK